MLLPNLCSYTIYSDPSETISDYRNFERMWTSLKDISKIFVLSLVVCSKRLIAVTVSTMGIGARMGTLALCRPGDAAWSVGTNELCQRLSDSLLQRKALRYWGLQHWAAYDLRSIEIVDENGNDEPRVSRTERIFIGVPIDLYPLKKEIACWSSYLVESCGRLLMVRRKTYCRIDKVYCRKADSFIIVADSSEFEVFEADFGRMLWTEVRSLGDDQTFFVGRGCSRAVRVSPYDLSRDSIFFVDDYIGSSWKKATTSSGVYDMKDRKVYSTFPMISWMSGEFPATWLFCQESTTNMLQLTGEHLQEHVEIAKEDSGTLLPGRATSSSAASTTSC